MIINDDETTSPNAPAPYSGAGAVSRVDQILQPVTDAGHYGYLKPKAEDLLADSDSAIGGITAVLDRLFSQFMLLVDEAEAAIVRVTGAWTGHADRLADEAMDSLNGLIQKAKDNLNRQLTYAHSLIESTGTRPVRTKNETAWVLTVPASVAAMKFVSPQLAGEMGWEVDTVSPQTATLTIGESPPGESDVNPSPVPGRQDVFDAVAQAIANLTPSPAIIRDVGDGANPLPVPVPDSQPDSACDSTPYAYQIIGNGAEYLPAPQTRPAGQYSPEADAMIVRLARDQSLGLTGQYRFTPPQRDALGYGTARWDFPSKPGGPMTVLMGATANGHPQPGDDPTYGFGLMGWSPQVAPSAVAADCIPQSPPPPPPPPPFVPALDGPQCCPAPEPVTNDWKATQPRPVQAGFSRDGLDWCDFLNRMVDAPTFAGPPGDAPPSGTPASPPSVWAATWNAFTKGTVNPYSIMKMFEGMKDPPKGSPAEAMMQKLGLNQELAKAHAEDIEKAGGVPAGKIAGLLSAYTLFSWAKTVTGWPTEYLGLPYEYALKYLIPRQIPGQADIDGMHVNGQISDHDWECYTRSLGNLPGVHRLVRDQKVTKPNLNEQVDLYMREQYTFPELREQLKHYGVSSDNDINKFLFLREQLPQFADIIRFMVRDTVNPKVVEDGKFDEGFDTNFKGILEKWALQQGITPELALQFWRAHWELPSPTMAYQMLHRLRPGRVDPAIATTYDDVKTLLGTADYAPGWRDKMMAISYLTPTRTDIKQGYIRGVYSRKEIIEMLQDTGLDKDGSESVAKLYDYEREVGQRTINEKNSAWSVKGAITEYVDGMLNQTEFKFILESFGIQGKRVDSIIATADMKALIATRRLCSKAIERQYMLGIVNDKKAVDMLIDRDHEADAAQEMVKQWSCRRSASVQEVPARKNLQWAIDGVITLEQFASRLVNLRYQSGDVDRYVQEAINRIREAAAKAAEKQLRDAISELRKRKAEYEKYIKDLEKKKKELDKQNQPKGK